MTRLSIFLLMSFIGAICAFFGAITWDTARAGAIAAAAALFIHGYFGEEA